MHPGLTPLLVLAALGVAMGCAAAQEATPTPIAPHDLAAIRGADDLVVIDLRPRPDPPIPGAEAPGAAPPPPPCVAVLAPGEGDALEAEAARMAAAGCAVRVLSGALAEWRAAGLLDAAPERAEAPGAVPFVIPRGLCEHGEPAQKFE